MLWTLWSLDVWGNETDGFEVNDRSASERAFELPDDADDQQIVESLEEAGYLRRSADVSVDGDDCFISIDGPNGYPMYQLTRND